MSYSRKWREDLTGVTGPWHLYLYIHTYFIWHKLSLVEYEVTCKSEETVHQLCPEQVVVRPRAFFLWNLRCGNWVSIIGGLGTAFRCVQCHFGRSCSQISDDGQQAGTGDSGEDERLRCWRRGYTVLCRRSPRVAVAGRGVPVVRCTSRLVRACHRRLILYKWNVTILVILQQNFSVPVAPNSVKDRVIFQFNQRLREITLHHCRLHTDLRLNLNNWP